MPRILANKKKYKFFYLGSWVIAQLHMAHKTQQGLADELGITRQALHYKIKNNAFDYKDLLTIIEFLDVPDEEIIHLMKI